MPKDRHLEINLFVIRIIILTNGGLQSPDYGWKIGPVVFSWEVW